MSSYRYPWAVPPVAEQPTHARIIRGRSMGRSTALRGTPWIAPLLEVPRHNKLTTAIRVAYV